MLRRFSLGKKSIAAIISSNFQSQIMTTTNTRSKILEAKILPPEEGESITTLIAGQTDVIDERHKISAIIFGLRLGLKNSDNVNGAEVIEIQLAEDALCGLPINRLREMMNERVRKEGFVEHEDSSITFFTGMTREKVAKALGVSVEEVREHQLQEQLEGIKFDLIPDVEFCKIKPGAITEIITRQEVRDAILDFVRSRNLAPETTD